MMPVAFHLLLNRRRRQKGEKTKPRRPEWAISQEGKTGEVGERIKR